MDKLIRIGRDQWVRIDHCDRIEQWIRIDQCVRIEKWIRTEQWVGFD